MALDTPSTCSEWSGAEKSSHGRQKKRIATVSEGPRRLLHRHGTGRPSLRSPRAGTRGRRQCHVRAWRANGVAYTSARPDAHRHGGLRPRAALGRPDRGDSTRRRRFVRAKREALARRRAHDSHDAHRHSGTARRQDRRLDGESQRRTIWAITSKAKSRHHCHASGAVGMRIGILGSGLMGGKLGTLFARAGHDVVFSYARGERKLKRLAREALGHARAGTPREAALNADALLL